MNYVDRDYVIDDLAQIHRKGYDIEVNWLSGQFAPAHMSSTRIKKSIVMYRQRLQQHLASENVDVDRLIQLKFCWPAKGRKYMQAIDDRGKKYKIYVQEYK